jgi:hypothetical protein
MKHPSHSILGILAGLILVSCGPADKIWPSDKIGPMWVNRYGHSNLTMIWEYCSWEMTDVPGIRTTECTVPKVNELFIGGGLQAPDKDLREALWEARTWELFIDGYEVDLPAFNVVDFYEEADGKRIEYRLWRIRLRNIPDGLHTLRYVMHVNRQVENDPLEQSPGTYELTVNFTVKG